MPRPLAPGSAGFIALIAAMMTITAMSIDINLPAVPTTAEVLGASLTTAQLTVTLFFLGFAVGQLLWGSLSDRVGRKPTLLAGLVLYELATIGCAFAPSMPTLLALRVLQGFAAGAGAVLGRAVIRDLFEGEQMARALSLVLAAFVTAPIVAPTIGALILSFAGWRWIFGFLALYGLVLLVLAVLFLEESLKRRNPHALRLGQLAGSFAAMFRHPGSRAWALIVVLTFGALTVYLTNASAVLMEGYGLSAATFGGAFALVAVCASAGNLINSRLVRQGNLPRVVRRALAAAITAAALALGLAASGLGGVWAVIVALGLFFTAFGLIAANATTLALQPHAQAAGAAASALGFAQTVIPALVASLVAFLYDGTAVPMLAAILLLIVAAWLLAWRMRMASPGRPSDAGPAPL